MGQVIFMAQLTWEFHLLLFFCLPISIVCGFWLVLVSLTFLSLFIFSTRLLIALVGGLRKNICIMGWGGSLCCLHRRVFDEQLMEFFSQRLYNGIFNLTNHTINMGSRLMFLCIVGGPRCLRDNLIQDLRLWINQIQLLGPKNGFFFIHHSWSGYVLRYVRQQGLKEPL